MRVSPAAFRVLLGIAFAITMGLHARWTWATFVMLRDGPGIADVRIIDRVSDQGRITKPPDELARQGVKSGDRVWAVGGTPVWSRADVFRAIRWQPANRDVTIEFERREGGERYRATWNTGQFQKQPFPVWTWFYGFAVNVFTPGICIVLAFFVVWQRPESALAWLLLVLLYGLSQAARFNGVFRLEYSRWFSIPGEFLLPWATIVWPAAWLWFSLDFPQRGSAPKWLDWTRWVVGPLAMFFAVVVGIESVLNLEFARGLGWDPVFEALNTISMPFFVGAIATGMLSLTVKLRTEQEPDARRRLRLLCTGLALGMLPLMVGVAYGFGRIPEVGQIATVLMLVFVPVTVGYVLIVERAMDVGVVIRQGLQYAVARRSAMVLQGLLMIGLMLVVFSFGTDAMTSRPWRLTVIALAFGSVFFVQKLVELALGWIDRRFFREAVNAEHLLAELSEQVRTMVEPEALIATVTRRIGEALHVPRVEFARNGAGTAEWAELRLPVRAQGEALGELQLSAKKSEEPYSPNDVRLLESVATQTAFALENAKLTEAVVHEAAQRERIHREIEIAREVQERLLPKRAPDVPELEIAGVCVPAQAIGGDYFDYLPGAAGEVGFAIGDIAGKGIPASLLMASLQASLRGLIAGGVTELPELLARLNRLIHEATPANRFATFFYAWYEPEARVLRCGCAGHNAALLVRAGGEVEWVKPKGVALGLTRVAKYEEQRVELRAGDVLVLYTDGVTEAMNPEREEFGEERLAEAVKRARDRGAAGLLERLVGAVREFVREAPAHDDLTVVVLVAQGDR